MDHDVLGVMNRALLEDVVRSLPPPR